MRYLPAFLGMGNLVIGMVRTWWLAAVLWVAAAHADGVPDARNLVDDGHRALADGQAVVVLYTATYCDYCHAVKSAYFRDLEADRRYAPNIVLREVVIDGSELMLDFDGERVAPGEFASASGVSLVPTVHFVDGAGQALADPLVGVSNMDFYGWYLDIRLKQAMQGAREAGGQRG